MDTRFWGPSGWKLFHLVAAEPIRDEVHARAVSAWFALLPYILPCKYCRASLTDYYKLQPLTTDILHSPAAFTRWAYDIHNRVNAKLRGQGLLDEPDPSWSTIRDHYATEHATLCGPAPKPLLGWDFMTSVAYSTPGIDYVPVPMPDMPEEITPTEAASLPLQERNRYNLLTRQERLDALSVWWGLIPSILPCAAWRDAWAAIPSPPPLRKGRDAMMRWMWSVERRVCGALRCPTPHANRSALDATVGAFESGCGTATNRRTKTCRTRRLRQRDRVRTLRRRTGTLVY